MISPGLAAFKLAYEISPIVLVGGIATGIYGNALPIVSVLDSLSFTEGILGGGDLSLDDAFAKFTVLPGGTLIDTKYGEYPFANQNVAANAAITQPLKVSLRMDCPAKDQLGYFTKLAVMTALQSTLAQHTNLGGTYTVATPSAIYTNLLLELLTDITGGGDKQVQVTWRWDFRKPLLTLQQAASAQNALMSRVTQGLPTDGSLSGPASTVGFQPSVATGSVIPAASGAAAAYAVPSNALPSPTSGQ